MFQSIKHPHCRMNRYGVVLVPNGHADGATYYGKSFSHVPLRQGLLSLASEIESEAHQAGWTKRYTGNAEVAWSKPSR